jgi:hypothetical protein
MNELLSSIALLTLASGLAAQSVTTSIRAVMPLTVQSTNGSQSAQATQPAGPLPDPGQVRAQMTIADEVSAAWSSYSWPGYSEASLFHILASPPSQPIFGAALNHEFVISFTAAGGAVPAVLVLDRQHTETGGIPQPLIAIDVGNDGFIDHFGAGMFYSSPLTIGAQPLEVRVVVSSTIAGLGSSMTNVKVKLLPVNNTMVFQHAMGCGPGPGALEQAHLLPPYEVFADRGVDALINFQGALAVFVVGFTQQPVLLPAIGFIPCLLVPSPDVVLFQTTALHLPLPAAVRPITVHVQAVMLTSAGLRTTDGYTVSGL